MSITHILKVQERACEAGDCANFKSWTARAGEAGGVQAEAKGEVGGMLACTDDAHLTPLFAASVCRDSNDAAASLGNRRARSSIS